MKFINDIFLDKIDGVIEKNVFFFKRWKKKTLRSTLMKFYEILLSGTFVVFTGGIFYFSRPHSSFSRVGFGGKFHGDC